MSWEFLRQVWKASSLHLDIVVGVVLWWLLLLQLVPIICHSNHLKYGEGDNRQDAFSRAPVTGTRPSWAERHVTRWCSKNLWGCDAHPTPGTLNLGGSFKLGGSSVAKVHWHGDDLVCMVRMKERDIQGGSRTGVKTQACLHVCHVLPADVNLWLLGQHPPRCNCQLVPASVLSCEACWMVQILSLDLEKPWAHSWEGVCPATKKTTRHAGWQLMSKSAFRQQQSVTTAFCT